MSSFIRYCQLCLFILLHPCVRVTFAPYTSQHSVPSDFEFLATWSMCYGRASSSDFNEHL